MSKFSNEHLENIFKNSGIHIYHFTPEKLSKMTIQELLSLRMIGLSEQEEMNVLAEFEKPNRKREMSALNI
ncbi:hypothetical protein [Dolosicoccus paucivorans]|uniref:hypothetical protein n=1 Tax=Dolosicoccus paucivorans TaxID=84521 RepID=UPI0008864A93|nr:hypothetical protein [Dolosicoccus paucivorans]SDI40950.1 hypothetical protein SAMN04487994_101030 [Dolosicoccus paucivorans]